MEEVRAEPVKEKKINGFNEWEVEDFARTIMRAEEIKADPKKMEAVKPYLEKQVKAAASAAEILYGKKEENNANESKSN
jgi:hypothetical protein